MDVAIGTPAVRAIEDLPALPLDRDLDLDAIVLGGGLTGLTSAYLLAKAGIKVALVKRNCAALPNAASARYGTATESRVRAGTVRKPEGSCEWQLLQS